MRRLSLSKKLFAAALPLVLAVGALLALTVRADLRQVSDAERGAELGRVWNPLVAAMTSIETELADVPGAAASMGAGAGQTGAFDDATHAAALADAAANRRATDAAFTQLGDQIDSLGSTQAAHKHLTLARSSMSAARRSLDMATIAPDVVSDIDPIAAYDVALRELVSVGQLLPAESNDSELGRELLGVVKLAEARVAADSVLVNVQLWLNDPADAAPLTTARVHFAEVEAVMNEFGAIAPDEWAKEYRAKGFSTQMSKYRAMLDGAVRAAQTGRPGSFDVAGFATVSDSSLQLQSAITNSIVERSEQEVASTRRAALVRSGLILGAVAVAALIAWLIIRSITGRVRAVSRRANKIAAEQLPALVEALRDPRSKSVPEIDPIAVRGGDELSELAEAFNSMQSTLVDVANEQVEVLRRGVSDIFVTMARRNRSLIDRQLAMLDEFEAEVDDPAVLSNYYQLDHMATRMRRNSESLLVLANAEPKRRRVKATEIDDVVRAAIGEVEDYRRIDIEALESLQVKGNVVADVSHLLAELLDNATSFSPPDSVVRVGGRRAGDSYMLRIVDNGVGIAAERMRELNELLRRPPIVGLSVEPTLGVSVVSLLADRHDITVTLSQGSPGLTVDVLLPSSLFGPIDSPTMAGAPPPSVANANAGTNASTQPAPADHRPANESLVTWDVGSPAQPSTVAAEPIIDEQAERVRSWTTMSLDAALLSNAVVEERPSPYDDMPFPVASESDRFDSGFADVAFPEPAVAEMALPDAELAHIDFPDLDLSERPFGREATTGFPIEHDAGAAAMLPPPGSVPTPPPTPAPAVARGEFDRLPAPPVTVDGYERRLITTDDALPASTMRLPASDNDFTGLPTRTPGRGPEGPDRLAGLPGPASPFGAPPSVTPDAPVLTNSPSALQAALTAFDTKRPNGAQLPTRSPRPDGPSTPFEETVSTTQSRLDPEVLRERLRAFQTEFRTAAGGATHDSSSTTTTDLGGDLR